MISAEDLRWAMNRLPHPQDYRADTYAVPMPGGRTIRFNKRRNGNVEFWVLDQTNEPLEAP